jgi:hypothetical protein
MRTIVRRIAAPKRGRWWRALALAALALAALPARAFAVDDQPFVIDGPWIIEVGPEITVIADPGGDAIVGDAASISPACVTTDGCTAVWDEGVGAVIIVDQSPPVPASPAAPSSAASALGAVPR